MDWIFSHLQIFIVAGAIIASIISKARKARAAEEASEYLPPKVPERGMSDLDAERVRETIARKRAERERQVAQEARRRELPPVPAPVQRPPFSMPPPLPEATVASGAEREDAERLLARQLALAERMKELQARKQAVAKEVASVVRGVEVPSTRRRNAAALAADARNPAELRRAVLMTEILGKPIALR